MKLVQAGAEYCLLISDPYIRYHLLDAERPKPDYDVGHLKVIIA